MFGSTKAMRQGEGKGGSFLFSLREGKGREGEGKGDPSFVWSEKLEGREPKIFHPFPFPALQTLYFGSLQIGGIWREAKTLD